MKSLIPNILGWYGAVAILIAFALISFNIINSNSLTYQLLNLTGSIGIVVNASRKKDFPVIGLNICWVLIALVALIKIL